MDLKRVGIWTAVIGGLFLMVYGLAKLGAVQSQLPTGTIQDPVDSSDWVKGNLMAKNTLIEYGDFQCPGCASAAPFVNALEKTYDNQLRLVFRHFPLKSIHPNAAEAAFAAEAAGKQGKFWEMHDLLYANQFSWSGLSDPNVLFDNYATQLKLNLDQFINDRQSDVVKNKVERDSLTGERASVAATPSFYLNGQLVNYASYDDLERIIKQAIGQ